MQLSSLSILGRRESWEEILLLLEEAEGSYDMRVIVSAFVAYSERVRRD